jgi:UDP-N-acetylmuramoyl-tripeptide--D-alanyl-D-alanine ligase
MRRISSDDKRKYINLRRSFKSPVIGITGNIGKTSTLEMIRCVLEKDGRVLMNRHGYGNWKNNINTLERLSSDYDYALFEFDFNRGNNFGEVLRLIKPNIGIVTNMGDAHLSYLGNMLEIALQKSAVIKYLARDGTAILNKDDELSTMFAQKISNQNISRFGISQDADFFATDIKQLGPHGTKFKLNNKFEVTIPIYSLGDIYNFLAAVSSLAALGFEIKNIVKIFQKEFQLPSGRGKLYEFTDHYVIDESYTATPRALAKTTRSLVSFKSYVDSLVLIIGDMEESGPNIEEQHLNMGYFISALPIDHVITVGNYADYIGKGVSLIHNTGKSITNCNSVDEILKALDKLDLGKTAITAQGIGQVGFRRIIKHLDK